MYKISIPKGAKAIILGLRYEIMRLMSSAAVFGIAYSARSQMIGTSAPLLHRRRLKSISTVVVSERLIQG